MQLLEAGSEVTDVGWGLRKLTSATYLINIGTREQLLVGEFFSRDRLMMTLGCCLMPVNHSYYTFLLVQDRLLAWLQKPWELAEDYILGLYCHEQINRKALENWGTAQYWG